MKFVFSTLLSVVALQAHTASAALVGHWSLNEGFGTAAGNAANAAFPGSLTGFTPGSEWISGAPGRGNAVNFDGVDDIINTSYTAISGSAVRSLSAWIKYPVAIDSELDAIFSYGSNATSARWTVRIGSGAGVDQNRIRLEVSGGGVYGSTNLNDNQWHHIAMVQTGSTLGSILLYVDGTAQTLAYNGTGAAQAINTTVAAGQEVSIGGSKHSTTYNWQGGCARPARRRMPYAAPGAT